MKPLDLTAIAQPDALLIQHGLNSQGFLNLPDPKGIPGPKTLAAHETWWKTRSGIIVPPATDGATPATGGDIDVFRSTLVRVLDGEVGVRETGGNNRGARIDTYEGATWLDPEGAYAWCASFVCWGIRETLRILSIQPDWARPRTPRAYAFRDKWGPENSARGVTVLPANRIALPGDIVVFTFSHVGVSRARRGARENVLTIEGNTNAAGSREGEGVYRKSRKRSQISALVRIEEV